MKISFRVFLLINSAFLLLAALAQTGPSGGGYEIVKSTIDGGGGSSSGGGYSLTGTIGQPDAGVHTGGGYTLVGGFWGGASSSTSEPLNSFVIS